MARPNVTITIATAWDHKAGRGGWAVLLRHEKKEKQVSAHVRDANLNQLQLIALNYALVLLNKPCDVTVIGASQFIASTFIMLDWLVQYGWHTTRGATICNLALWQAVSTARFGHSVTFQPVITADEQSDFQKVRQLAVAEKISDGLAVSVPLIPTFLAKSCPVDRE